MPGAPTNFPAAAVPAGLALMLGAVPTLLMVGPAALAANGENVPTGEAAPIFAKAPAGFGPAKTPGKGGCDCRGLVVLLLLLLLPMLLPILLLPLLPEGLAAPMAAIMAAAASLVGVVHASPGALGFCEIVVWVVLVLLVPVLVLGKLLRFVQHTGMQQLPLSRSHLPCCQDGSRQLQEQPSIMTSG